MKRLTVECNRRGVAPASVYDYKSGVLIGDVTKANWTNYRIWAEGQSDVCEAHRCLSQTDIDALGIESETVIFLLD